MIEKEVEFDVIIEKWVEVLKEKIVEVKVEKVVEVPVKIFLEVPVVKEIVIHEEVEVEVEKIDYEIVSVEGEEETLNISAELQMRQNELIKEEKENLLLWEEMERMKLEADGSWDFGFVEVEKENVKLVV